MSTNISDQTARMFILIWTYVVSKEHKGLCRAFCINCMYIFVCEEIKENINIFGFKLTDIELWLSSKCTFI